MKLSSAAQARVDAAKAWPAWPGDDAGIAVDQFIWATGKMHQEGLDWGAAWFAINPLSRCGPMAWDRLCDELLEQFPRKPKSRALTKFLTVRLVECCPDQTRWQKAGRLVRLVLDADHAGGREIGVPGASMHAARYYYHYKWAGVAVGVREIAAHAGVSHTLAAQWVARWRRGEL